MLADLASRVGLDGSGDLLDVACGTGQVAFALAPHIAYIVGIDQEPGMVNFAAAKAAAIGLRNSKWHVARAEEFVADGFRLVTIGNAFHRLDRPAVAERARRWLRPGGFLALLWTSNVLEGSSQWQSTLDGCVRDWVERLDTADRVPATWASDIERLPHSTVLTHAGFEIVGRYEFTSSHDWSLAGLIGLLYSTSYFPRLRSVTTSKNLRRISLPASVPLSPRACSGRPSAAPTTSRRPRLDENCEGRHRRFPARWRGCAVQEPSDVAASAARIPAPCSKLTA